MQALYFDKKVQYKTDYPLPKPSKNEVLVKVLLAAVCTTDVQITRGYKGFKGVLGHEFVGVVKHSEDSSLIGKRVVADINIGCSNCDFCKRDLNNHCKNRKVLGILGKDGAFADYITVPKSNLFVVPDSVSDNQAVFTEILASAIQIIEQVHLDSSHQVAIVGDGKLASLITQVVKTCKCKIVVIGKHKENLNFFKEFAETLWVDNLKNERVFDVVIDCTGNSQGLQTALKIVKPRGKIVLKSTYFDRATIDLSQVVVNEIKIIGSRCGPMDRALDLLKKKVVKTEALVGGYYHLKDWEEAFAQRHRLKSVFRIN